MQHVADRVQAGALLAVGLDHGPGCLVDVGRLEHVVLGLGVLAPLLERGEVDRRELPLLERMPFALGEASALLLPADREPELDQVHAAAGEVALELGHLAQELGVLGIGAEPHHPLDPGAVVPGAVEEHDLALGRQVLDVALEVPLALFDRRRLLERDHPGATRVEVLHEALDRPALARGVSTLEQDHDPLPGVLDPRLELEQLDLEVVLLLLVGLAATSGCGTGRPRLPVSTSSSSVLSGGVP